MSLKKSILLFLLCCSLPVSLLAGGHDNLCVQTHFAHKGWDKLENIKLIKELGVGWIRDDIFWSSVEKEKGKYKIPEYVWEWIKEARKNDLKIILILNGANKELYKDEFDHDGYVNFARFVAKEMKGYVQAIELINEPFIHFRRAAAKLSDAPNAWNGYDPKTGKTNDWAIKYLKTMNAMADAINEVAPGEYKILGLGCSPPLNTRLLRKGVSKHIDGMVIHPYSYRMVPELQPYGNTPAFLERDGVVVGDKAGTFTSINKELMGTSAKNNGPKELWITELGYTTFIPLGPSNFGGFSEDAQAKYAQRHLMECLGTGVRLTSWYTFYCRNSSPYHRLAGFGIVHKDGTLKPAYHAIQTVAKTMNGWKADKWGDVRINVRATRPDQYPITWDGSLRETFGTPRAYMFSSKNDKRKAVAIWSTERARCDRQPRAGDVTITIDKKIDKITAFDMLTKTSTDVKFTQKGNFILMKYLTVPDHPVMLYLEGDAPVTATSAGCKDMDIFSSKNGWKLYKAKSAKAEWSIADNAGTIKLNKGSKGFVGAAKTMNIGTDTESMSFKVKSSIRGSLLIRLIDSDRTTHQYKLPLAPSNQWECYNVDLKKGRRQSWGKNKKKEISYPVKQVIFGTETSADDKATIEFKDLQFIAI